MENDNLIKIKEKILDASEAEKYTQSKYFPWIRWTKGPDGRTCLTIQEDVPIYKFCTEKGFRVAMETVLEEAGYEFRDDDKASGK